LNCGRPFRLGLAALLFAVSGCASHRPAASRRAHPTESPGLLQILSTTPATGSVSAADLCMLTPGERRYTASADNSSSSASPDSVVTRTLAPTTQFNGSVSVAENHSRTEFWNVIEHGDVQMTAVMELKDNAISLFTPPLVIAFADLPAGEERRSESAMRVVDMKNRTRQRESGKAVRTMTYVSDQAIRIPSGQFQTKRVEVHFIADLKLAKADEQTMLWVVPGVGVVAEQSVEEVRVLGLTNTKASRTLVLASPIAPSAGPAAEASPASQPEPQ
jgi:hypothetical protein